MRKTGDEASVLKFIGRRIGQHKAWLVGSFVFAACAALVQIQTATLVKRLLDEALIPKDWQLLVRLCAFMVVLFLFDSITDFFHRFTLRVAAERTVRDLRREIFDRLLMQSSEQAATGTSGQAVTHVLSDTYVVGQGLHIVADLFREPLILIGMMGYLLTLNWRLTLICLVAIPIIGVLGRALGKSARRNQSRIQTTLDGISNHINETVRGLRTAHAFNQGPRLKGEFADLTEASYGWLVRLARTEEIVSPLTKWFTSWVGAGLILLEGWFVTTGRMTTGEAVAFVTAAGLLQQPLRQLNQVAVRLQTVGAAGERLKTLLTRPLDDIGRAQEAILKHTTPRAGVDRPLDMPLSLEFQDVAYRYPSLDGAAREAAVDGIQLTLPPGVRLAFVGPSGSGKTTLSLLALRFLDPNRGTVKLGGIDARSWDLADYRSRFAYVSQDVFLFNRSLRENLLFARPGATESELWAALERASIREFVEKLPGRLDSNLTEFAANLSGGEKQRISIARAFLKDAPLLILDEATSQLDALSEKAVQTALAELMQKRTVLIIAHRLASIRDVNQVAVIAGGRIAELGQPDTLLANPNGAFTKLWAAQGR